MSISNSDQNAIITLLVGMFDAAPSDNLLLGFSEYLTLNPSMTNFANTLTSTDEFKSLYPESLTPEQFSIDFATNILGGNTDRETLNEAITFVQHLLNEGHSQGEVIQLSVDALLAIDVENAKWGQAVLGLQNKVDVATYFATNVLDVSYDFQELRAVINGVTADPTTVADRKALLSISAGDGDDNIYLTTSPDLINGTDEDDTFVSWIFDNQNTLQSDDYINGKGGNDILIAQVSGVAESDLQVHSYSVEQVNFNTMNLSNESGDAENSVTINVRDMVGTNTFGSVESIASLVLNEIRHNSHQTTLVWKDAMTGVNFEGYFEDSYITGSASAGSTVIFNVLDSNGIRSGGGPLLDNPYDGIVFSMAGTVTYLSTGEAFNTSYQKMVDDINEALLEAELTTLTASIGESFTIVDPLDGLLYEGNSVVLTNSGSETLEAYGFFISEAILADGPHTEVSSTAPVNTGLTELSVLIDAVGLDGNTGDFVAGQKDDSGIQQFNMMVDRTSWIDTVSSTNGMLEKLIIDNTGDNGDLSIEDIDNVRLVDATTMIGKVSLGIELTEQMADKYSSFEETLRFQLGNNDDTLSLDIDAAVAEIIGYSMSIDTGNGNDTVILSGSGDASINLGEGDDTISIETSSNNIIDLGVGNDLVVWEVGNTGKNTIFNFSQMGSDADQFRFSAYLNDAIASSVTHGEATANNILEANEIILLNGFTENLDAGETFLSLTAEHLLNAVNSSNIDGDSNYGNLSENSLDAGNGTVTSRDHMVFVHNETNQGEYKLFHLLSLDDNTNNDFQSATLVGSIDVGDELSDFSALNILLG